MARTLPQQLYLLSYDVDKDRLTSGRFRGVLMRAGALIELTLDGYLDDEHGRAVVRGGRPPADSFLASMLGQVPSEKPRRWQSLIARRQSASENAVRDQLAADGAITIHERTILGVFRKRTVRMNDPNEVTKLRETARWPIIHDIEPSVVAQREAALSVLAATAELGTVFTWSERREHRKTIKALSEELGGAAPGLRKAISSIKGAMAASAAHGGS